MDGINQLDLITQRVLSLQVKTLTDELGNTMEQLSVAQKRVAELEAQIPHDAAAEPAESK